MSDETCKILSLPTEEVLRNIRSAEQAKLLRKSKRRQSRERREQNAVIDGNGRIIRSAHRR